MNQAADDAARAGGLDSLAVVQTSVSPFEGLARRALLRTLLREHFEARERAGGNLPHIGEYLAAFPDAAEQAVVREVFAEQLPALRIELGREIGRGGMGVIYEGRQTAVGGRRVAVKMLDAGLAGQAALWNRLREEVDILGQLHSTSIVQVFDVGLINGQLAVVMELAEQNLQQRTGGLPQDQREAAQLVRKLAVAVQKAHDHERKLIHQDLKPSNVLAMPDGETKVADFGLFHSAKASDTPAAARIVGTPGWLAPEQARGEPPTFATDVWGLGAVLYFLLTGSAPFPTKREQIDAVLTEALADVALRRQQASGDALDPNLAAIVAKCLQKNPGDRYRRPIDLADDLRRYLNAEPVQAALKPRAKRSTAARFALITGIAVACVAAAVPLTQWATSAGQSADRENERKAQTQPDAEHNPVSEQLTDSTTETHAAAPGAGSTPTDQAADSPGLSKHDSPSEAATQPVGQAATKPSELQGSESLVHDSTRKSDTGKSNDRVQPATAKPEPKPAAPPATENHFFAREFAGGPTDCQFDLPIDDQARALMADDVRRHVAADPNARLHESWDFGTRAGRNNERRVTFTRTLTVRYSEGGAPREVTLDTRYGECTNDNASRFFKPGKHYFITESSFGSLKEKQERTLSLGAGARDRKGKLQWKGATKNFYELTGNENNDLIIWGLIPKQD